ncbi:HAT, C-terminal dimerisation domain [Cinara cedri]|uniref:HAT, C-terminal dimerisation domain n=1 Tax=Cinara cedri TaxID=506608 RepID=A0A5E4NQ02_9HEMI|nr:HAT, C-terminal dimerisation domain [Cinara cedri]
MSLYENELDFDAEYFAEEFIQFQSLIISTNDKNTIITPSDQKKSIKNMQMSHTFQNVETCLHIFMTMPVNNCTGERSFSVLKRIKNSLRSSLGQEMLDVLGILSIENDISLDALISMKLLMHL